MTKRRIFFIVCSKRESSAELARPRLYDMSDLRTLTVSPRAASLALYPFWGEVSTSSWRCTPLVRPEACSAERRPTPAVLGDRAAQLQITRREGAVVLFLESRDLGIQAQQFFRDGARLVQRQDGRRGCRRVGPPLACICTPGMN